MWKILTKRIHKLVSDLNDPTVEGCTKLTMVILLVNHNNNNKDKIPSARIVVDDGLLLGEHLGFLKTSSARMNSKTNQVQVPVMN
jgi:hypothetical protein